MPETGKRKVQVIEAIPKRQPQKRARQHQDPVNRSRVSRVPAQSQAHVELTADDIAGPRGAGQGSSSKGPTTKRPTMRSAGTTGQTSLERWELLHWFGQQAAASSPPEWSASACPVAQITGSRMQHRTALACLCVQSQECAA